MRPPDARDAENASYTEGSFGGFKNHFLKK
jgi:hypothetical protein